MVIADLSDLSIQVFPFVSRELFPFDLKEALYGFSLAHPNRRPHVPCASGRY